MAVSRVVDEVDVRKQNNGPPRRRPERPDTPPRLPLNTTKHQDEKPPFAIAVLSSFTRQHTTNPTPYKCPQAIP